MNTLKNLIIFLLIVNDVIAIEDILASIVIFNRKSLNLSGKCDNDLEAIKIGLEKKQPWALKGDKLI
jgi:hypothetical protein